jgi:RNA polymerase sigma-70 factor, ECF subfamily
VRGTTVDAASMPRQRISAPRMDARVESTGSADLPAGLPDALYGARSGDESRFGVLYRDLQPRLARYATVLVGRDDADDVTAEAWLQIARDLHTFTGNLDDFRGWASTIVRNRAMDLLRAGTRRPQTPSSPQEFPQKPATQDTASAALETLSTDAAIRLISTLPRTEAEAVLLRAVVGLDTAAAAAVLGKRPGAVRVAAHRGLRRLARHVRYLPQEGRWTVE